MGGRRWEERPRGYLKEVWCIAIELLGVAEASGTIGQVSYGLLRKEVLDDAGVMAIALWGGGSYTTSAQIRLHMYMSCIHRQLV